MQNAKKILITGGAGFIGSNLVECLLNRPDVSFVRVLDDLSNGYFENIESFLPHPKFEFVKGDIKDYGICLKACEGIDKVSHQAALGSVPRSIENPMASTAVNILGTVNLLHACHVRGIERIILAFSSSTYGDHPDLPKVENTIGKPLSPYAVTKACIEQFAQVFGQTYGLKWIGLRYFNVFGRRQSSDNPYAAVIPLFIDAALKNKKITIFGDGNTSRDFTHIENVIQVNMESLFSENEDALMNTYNVACGKQTTLTELARTIIEITNSSSEIVYAPERLGDVKHSLADVTKARELLNFMPDVDVYAGLAKTISYMKSQRNLN